MITRFACVYVRCLFAFEMLLFVMSLLLYVSVLFGSNRLVAEYGKPLLYCAFVVSVPAFSLAKEKNVRKNEFNSCPRWLRMATLIFMIIGIVVAPVQAMFSSSGDSFEEQPLFISGVPFFLESMSLCILYSLLWAGPVSAPQLVKRVRISIIALAVCLAFIVADHLGYLPHRSSHE
jgi:sterol desaturase/sphingolipid hydroxylase (fatty acid hydroxylase superfamily)